MSMHHDTKKPALLVLLLLAVVGGVGYGLFVLGGGDSAYAQSESTPSASIIAPDYVAEIQQADITIQRFEAIALDAAFLSSPEFRALRDYSVSLQQARQIGRSNPFAALEVETQEESVAEQAPVPDPASTQSRIEEFVSFGVQTSTSSPTEL